VISQKSGPASGHIGGVANGRDTETHAALHTLTAAAGELVAAHQNLLLQAETLFVRHSGDDLRLVLNAFVEATRTWNDAHHSATNSRLDAIDRRLVEITYQTQVLLQLLRHAQSLVSKSDMAVALEVTTSSNNGTVDTPAQEPEVYTNIQSDGLHEAVEVERRPEGPTDGHAQTEAAGLAIADGEQEPSLLRDLASEENPDTAEEARFREEELSLYRRRLGRSIDSGWYYED
jgi:hypothetical protein